MNIYAMYLYMYLFIYLSVQVYSGSDPEKKTGICRITVTYPSNKAPPKFDQETIRWRDEKEIDI